MLHALPQIFVGLKVAIWLAVIGAVIAEFVGADAGLGFVIVPRAEAAAVGRRAPMIPVLTWPGGPADRRLLPDRKPGKPWCHDRVNDTALGGPRGSHDGF
ncbi:hypothetical protein [Amycolatopsis sp. lyj-346]|uniref:hypothetical protein n=1 Tax=Amycolatopsis sp. lyj-346 TaxID=2789289 RepID=UPI0039793635